MVLKETFDKLEILYQWPLNWHGSPTQKLGRGLIESFYYKT